MAPRRSIPLSIGLALLSLEAGVVVGFCPRAPSRTVGSRIAPSSSTTLAAKGGGKKKKKKPRGEARTAKGFGAPPPAFEDILSTFTSRVPEDPAGLACPCGAGPTYGACCEPLHTGARPLSTMTDVLRSRYVAFSWRMIDHVMRTTHPTCRDHRDDRVAWARDLDKGGMFDAFEFVKLEEGEEEMSAENDDEGYLDFKVTLRAREDKGSAVAGQETVIAERSRFLRDPEDGTWSYASGDVRSEVAGLEDTTLNA